MCSRVKIHVDISPRSVKKNGIINTLNTLLTKKKCLYKKFKGEKAETVKINDVQFKIGTGVPSISYDEDAVN